LSKVFGNQNSGCCSVSFEEPAEEQRDRQEEEPEPGGQRPAAKERPKAADRDR
jgi:hypothetical protein